MDLCIQIIVVFKKQTWSPGYVLLPKCTFSYLLPVALYHINSFWSFILWSNSKSLTPLLRMNFRARNKFVFYLHVHLVWKMTDQISALSYTWCEKNWSISERNICDFHHFTNHISRRKSWKTPSCNHFQTSDPPLHISVLLLRLLCTMLSPLVISANSNPWSNTCQPLMNRKHSYANTYKRIERKKLLVLAWSPKVNNSCDTGMLPNTWKLMHLFWD